MLYALLKTVFKTFVVNTVFLVDQISHAFYKNFNPVRRNSVKTHDVNVAQKLVVCQLLRLNALHVFLQASSAVLDVCRILRSDVTVGRYATKTSPPPNQL